MFVTLCASLFIVYFSLCLLFQNCLGLSVNDVQVDVVVGVRDPVFGSSIVGVQYGGCGEEGLVLNLPFDTLVQGETVSKELGIQFNTLVQSGTVSKDLSIHFNTVVQGEQYLET